jgi:hypothetical protein
MGRFYGIEGIEGISGPPLETSSTRCGDHGPPLIDGVEPDLAGSIGRGARTEFVRPGGGRQLVTAVVVTVVPMVTAVKDAVRGWLAQPRSDEEGSPTLATVLRQ